MTDADRKPYSRCGVCGTTLETFEIWEKHWKINENGVEKCKYRWDKNGVYDGGLGLEI